MLTGLARAKRMRDNVWVEGYLVRDWYGKPHIIDPKTVETDGNLVVINGDIPEFVMHTVGLYTGKEVRMPNGDMKKLFTGDIIFARGSRLLVDFDRDFFAFWTYYFDSKGERRRLCPLSDIAPWEWGSIVGNIYDNPKMVENFK